MGVEEIIEGIRGWDGLDEAGRTSLNEALADLTVFTDGELDQIVAAAREVSAEITAGDIGDDALAALEWLADSVEAITETLDARAAEDKERAERAEALASRIAPPADGGGDDGEPEAAETGVDGDETASEDDPAPVGQDEAPAPENADERVPVAASSQPRIGRVSARRPQRAEAVVARSEPIAPLVAAAGVPNVAMGTRLDSAASRGRAFADAIQAMGTMSLRPGFRVPVATASAEFDPEGFLDGNARENYRKLQAVTSRESIVAAGGVCAPPVPRYDLPSFGSSSRPVRDALTRFGAERGGVILPEIPRMTDLDDAVGFWTVEDDEDAAGDEDPPRKPCLTIDCGTDVTVVPYAVTRCVEIGNWNARTWPERVDEFLRLLDVQTARKAETRLLTRIGDASTNITVPQYLGTARDVLTTIDLAIAGYESRHRVENGSFTMIAPSWLRRQMRSDLTREMPGSADERLAAADATIDSFLAARGVTVRWTLDGEAGQIFGTQADGAISDWMPTAVVYLFETGTWLGLDGGELNLGVVRDSNLNAKNSYQIFSEFWEAPAFYGLESLRLTMTLCPDGSTAGTVVPFCADDGGDG